METLDKFPWFAFWKKRSANLSKHITFISLLLVLIKMTDMMYGDNNGYSGGDAAPGGYPPPDQCVCDPCLCDDASCDPDSMNKPAGYEEDAICPCDPCLCSTPPGSPNRTTQDDETVEATEVDEGNPYQLDEFSRAKSFFLNTSAKSGLSLYDHLAAVIRKILDDRGPNNAVDYLEEISMNVKRYAFFPQSSDGLRDVFQISDAVLKDAQAVKDIWKQFSDWNDLPKEVPGEGFLAGSFQNNLLRLQYYLECVNVGLPREEMYRVAVDMKDLCAARPFISKARFWGKIFGMRKDYYVIEVDMGTPGSGGSDLWQAPAVAEEPADAAAATPTAPTDAGEGTGQGEEKVPPAQETLEKAGSVVLNADILTAYSKTSGLPPDQQAGLLPKGKGNNNDDMAGANRPPPETWGGEGAPAMKPEASGMDPEAAVDVAKWRGFQEELMLGLPVPKTEEVTEIPPEAEGTGVNRRAFYVCNALGEPWVLLPISTPQQMTASRKIKWGLTGELDAKIQSFPPFPGVEGHLLKTMLSRASAGSLVSPKGYYRIFPNEVGGEDEDDDDIDEMTENAPGEDIVYASKKYKPELQSLLNPDFWVHHSSFLLPQGRNQWWNPTRSADKKKRYDTEDETEDETDEELDGEGQEGGPIREVGEPLFTPVTKDVSPDGKDAWTLLTSSSVFKEFQVVTVRSNCWPGSSAICTAKGKVENIYLGNGQKFGVNNYASVLHIPILPEFQPGPQIEEIKDPGAEDEQNWLNDLEAMNKPDDESEALFTDTEGEEIEETDFTEED